MLEPHAPEIRQELAAARLAALHRSAASATPGPLRRAAGSALVRLGLRLGYEGSVPPLVAQPGSSVGARLEPGTHTPFPSRRRAISSASSRTVRDPRGPPQNVMTLRIPS
jgi:hypothetical protein